LQSNFEKQKAMKFWIGLRTMKGTHTIFCRGRLNKWKHYYFPNFQTESIWQKCWFPWYSCCDTGTIRSTVANIWVPATKVWAQDHAFKNYRRTNRGAPSHCLLCYNTIV